MQAKYDFAAAFVNVMNTQTAYLKVVRLEGKIRQIIETFVWRAKYGHRFLYFSQLNKAELSLSRMDSNSAQVLGA
jgi:hypothetical protein